MSKDAEVEVKRLVVGDEELAQTAMLLLVPEDERDGQTPSLGHLRQLLAAPSNCLILALLNREPIGFTIAYAMPRYDREQ